MHFLVRYPFFNPTHLFAPFTIASLSRPIGYKWVSWRVFISLIFATTVAQAASLTDADQELLRQQARERILRQQQEPTSDVRLERPLVPRDEGRLPLDESPCFKIERIQLKGEAATQFQWALASANHGPKGIEDAPIGRCLSSGGIDLIMRRVQNTIMAKGYVTARILAEPQDLSTNTLTLTLIPGRIRTIRFANGTDTRATQWNALPAHPGDLLNLRDIEQGLENFKRLPTAEADIQIAPGEQPGESDIVIQWKQAFPVRFTLSVDDSGSKSTGKYIGGVTVAVDHLLTLNDLFYLSFNHDLGSDGPGKNGSRGYSAHYSIPYGYWLLGFTASENTYRQSVAGINQTYLFSGESQNSEIKLSRLVYRDAVRKTTVSLRGWTRASKNHIDDTEIEIQRRRTSGWEAGLAHREFIGAAALDLSLDYRRGTGAMDAKAAPEEASGDGASRLQLVTAETQLSLPFTLGTQALRYSIAGRAQWNRTPLVPQDRFAIGGRYTVRGFDGENSLSADRGWLIRNELDWYIGHSGHAIYLGLDYGEVGGRASANLIGTRLAGAVLGLRGRYKTLNYDIFVGQPITKPEGFRTANTAAGFNFNWSF
jgi:hemolysin activation/secretion protein